MKTKLFVKKILEKAEHYDWSIQGFGMLRLYLSSEVRLHVWDPDRAFPGVSTIHTHPWDFTSEIIVGSLTDRTYLESCGEPTHQKQQIVCGAGACTVGAASEVRLSQFDNFKYVAGQSYKLMSFEIHESFPERGCVSLITRTFKEDTEHADVFFPLNTEWKCSEPRKATPAEVRSMCDLALCVMSGQNP